MSEMTYASNAKGNLGVALGAVGTGLSVLAPHMGGLFGGYGNGSAGYVSHEAFELQQRISSLESEKALLASEQNTEVKIADVFERLSVRIKGLEDKQNDKWAEQGVYNATNTATVSVMGSQLAQLQALTKLVVPADNVCPKPMPQYNSWTAPTA